MSSNGSSRSRGLRPKEHLPNYASRDWEVVDYQLYELGDTGLSFRGPEPVPLEPGTYFVCIGAAQTFGCFCRKPFPSILSEGLSVATLNLGYGGAGPAFFVRRDDLHSYINKAAFAVVQVMSGRSESNDLFESGGLEYLTRRSDGVKMSSNKAYADLLLDNRLRGALPHTALRLVRTFLGPRSLRRLIKQTRANWVLNYQELLSLITVPTVLLWFSTRSWLYWQRYSHLHGIFGAFPQFVTPAMMRRIRPHADAYVSSITVRGTPQPLISRFTGEPVEIDLSKDRSDFKGTWTENGYYPSPEMHEDAAAELLEPCRRVLAGLDRSP